MLFDWKKECKERENVTANWFGTMLDSLIGVANKGENLPPIKEDELGVFKILDWEEVAWDLLEWNEKKKKKLKS